MGQSQIIALQGFRKTMVGDRIEARSLAGFLMLRQLLSVMPIKIKHKQPEPTTPLRHSQHTLKNLSEQRNLRKLSKQKSGSIDADSSRELLQSLTYLQEQAELLATLPKSRNASIVNRGVPRTTITLRPRQSQQYSLSQSSPSERSLQLVSIGSLCQQKKPKRKGIEISLRSRRKVVS